MMTSLDREAEYRADQGAEVYLARAGMNPLALYSLLQKLTALGSESASLAQLYKTHPPARRAGRSHRPTRFWRAGGVHDPGVSVGARESPGTISKLPGRFRYTTRP